VRPCAFTRTAPRAMLLATNTLAAAGGGAGVGVGVAVGVGAGVGVALAVADAVAVGLVAGAGPAALVVPQAASNTGAMKVNSTFMVICCSPRKLPLHAHRNLARERDIPSHRHLYLAGLLAWSLIGSTRSLDGYQSCSQGCRSTPTTSQAGSPESRHGSLSVRTRSSVGTD